MVHQSPQQRSLTIAIFVFVFFLGVVFAVGAAWVFKKQTVRLIQKTAVVEETPEEFLPTTPELIDLQPVVDEWLATLNKNATVGIEIFDLDNGQIIAEHNKDDVFSTESLYKLFVVYEGYRRVEQGIVDPETSLGGHTNAECLDLAIRESNSSCAEAIRATIGANNLEEIIETDFGLENSSNLALTSTASDITKIMKLFYEHSEFSEETWAKIQDSMLNQPPVDNGLCDGPCDWRRGLPSGFEVAKVYNKVGWRYSTSFWASYHDTAIVEFENPEHHYIITVMTSHVDFEDISEFGSMLESQILSAQ